MKRNGRALISRLTVLLLAVLLIPAFACIVFAEPVANVSEEVCYEHGDVNGDGVVDSRDAIHVLYYSAQVSGSEKQTQVNQDCDFNGDGAVTAQDAIYVLYSSFHMVDSFTLDGMIHEYKAPLWNWEDDGSVTVEFVCGCGETVSFTKDDGVTVETQTTEATCTTAGQTVYSASVTFEEQEYTSEHVVVIDAKGHDMVGEQTCTTASSCNNCDLVLAVLGHEWEQTGQTEATCVNPETRTYKCKRCPETDTKVLEGLERHAFKYVEDVQVDGCKWAKQYECDNCDATETGETYYVHTYAATLTKEATCSVEGEKTFTCADCKDSYTEKVETNDSHTWGEGVLDENTGVTTYTCTACPATKTAVLAEGNTATVSKENLQTSELQLNDAAIKLDEQTLAGLGEQVQIDVNVTDTENIDVELGTEEKAQIGTNPIYNFDMYSDDEQVSEFGGQITISLPYTLQPGDDVDCIDVWFINDSGEVECVQGTYSNGFVTFTTDHFSYYTVTRLTPRQRCEHYGHVAYESYKAATCTANGHDIYTCKRCGNADEKEKNVVLPMLQHDYKETVVAATCTAAGSYKKVCSLCEKEISGELPALGHAWDLDKEASQEETCTEAGWNVYVCSNDGCTESYRDELPAKGHKFEDTETVNPDCLNHGHKKQTCSNCGAKQEVDKKAPTGHDYKAENAIWEWAEDYSEATVTLVCSYDENHTKELTAVVSRQFGAEGTCSDKITYKAVASFNKAVFEDTQEVDTGEVQHQPGAIWQSNGGMHYHVCGICGERVDAVEHVFEETSRTEPTCGTNGLIVGKCAVCGYVKETALTPVGEHTYVKGVCSVCGHEADDCQHLKLYRQVDVDLSEYDLCGDVEMFYLSCDCGKESTLHFNQINCKFGEPVETFVEAEEGSFYLYRYECSDCGLVMYNGLKPYVDKETCYGGEGEFYAFTMGSETIAEGYTHKMPAEEHYATILNEEIDLSDYGLCGVVLEIYTCYCGEQVRVYDYDTECWFVWDESLSGDDENVFVCQYCDTILRIKYTAEEEQCKEIVHRAHSYEKDGKVVFSYTDQHTMLKHDTQMSYQMMGATCEDGVIVTYTCSKCDYVETSYLDWCVPLISDQVPLKNVNFCGDTFWRESCACGNYEDCGIYGEGNCEMVTISVSEDELDVVEKCTICGMIRSTQTTVSEKDENCFVDVEEKVVYSDANGTKVAEGTRLFNNTDHDSDVTYTFHEGALNCEDGVTVTEICRDCGYIYNGNRYDHSMEVVDTYDLTDYGLCGGFVELYECFCGEESISTHDTDICNWYYDIGGEDYDIYWCPQCNVNRKELIQDEEIGQCLYRRTVTYTYYNDDGVLLEFDYSYNTTEHRDVAEITKFGETCDDGYTVTKVCLDCGNEDKWGTYYGCSYWDLERTIITNGELCGEVELVKTGCACGKLEEMELNWIDGKCDLQFIEQTDDVTYFVCATCGAEHEQRYRNERVPDSCVVRWVNEYIWFRDGEEILSYEVASESRNHKCLFSFELLGDTCDDGYYVTENCMYCDYSWTSEDPSYGCSYYMVEKELAHDGTGLCGPVYIETERCACGALEDVVTFNSQCPWTWTSYDDETETTHYTCYECGAQRELKETSVPGETVCEEFVTVENRFFKDGEELGSFTHSVTVHDHEQLHTFNLWGDTCEEGYDVTATCTRCGDVKTYKVYEGSHGWYLTDVIDLSEYGTCGGEIRIDRCPCGKVSDWWYETENCESYEDCVDPETGWEGGYCEDCDTYRYTHSAEEYDRDSCTKNAVEKVKFVRDGETVLALSAASKEDFHAWEIESIDFEGEDGSVEGGYNVTQACDSCGKTETWWNNGHSMYGKETFWMEDLTEDACGGFITIDQCGCGKEYGFSLYMACSNLTEEYYSEEDENGVTHSGMIYTCDDCGLELVTEYFTGEVDAENCTSVYHGSLTVKMNDEVVKELAVEYDMELHTWGNPVYSLEEGRTDCYEGVRYDVTCKYCDETSWGEVYEHVLVPDADFETINLQDYGAVCETTIQKMACLCGEQCEFVLAGENRCDMNWVVVNRYENPDEIWIEDYIKEGQYQACGWQYPDSYFWNVTCAVTDPQCGYKMRVAEYWQWVEGTCVAKQYQSWDLYTINEDGEVVIAENITLATGRQQTWHPYENEVTCSDVDEETNTWTEVDADVCPLCGSSYTETRTYLIVPDEDGDLGSEQIAYEEDAINLLDNGETKRHTYGYEQDFVYNGYRFITYSHQETIYGDDSEYWYWERCFDYDFTDGCKCRREYRNSNDIVHDDTIDAHITEWELATIKQKTCTQFGIEADQWFCVVCGQIVDQDEPYEVEPTAHTWWYNDENGYYECHDCGLQNVNGSSGTIVLEDMTEEYGDGENYVVGYWNREDVEAIQYVSILLAEVPEGADDEVLLDVEITEMEDITAVSFSMAEVQAAAEEAGYTDGYVVRFTFVPVNAEDTLDYAITFGDLAA